MRARSGEKKRKKEQKSEEEEDIVMQRCKRELHKFIHGSSNGGYTVKGPAAQACHFYVKWKARNTETDARLEMGSQDIGGEDRREKGGIAGA